MSRKKTLISIIIGAATVLLSAVPGRSYETGSTVFNDSFENGSQTSNYWAPGNLYVFDAGCSGQGIRIENTDSNGSVYIGTSLPSDLKGYPVYLSAAVRGTDISQGPDIWNGVKCMVVYKTSEGLTGYLQADAGTGTFGWTNIARLIHLPATVTNITLVLGLEKVSGTVWFDDVRLKVVGLDNRMPARPNQPVFKGHSLPRLRGAMVPTSLTAESLAVFAQDWKGNLIRWQLGECTYTGGLATAGYDTILEAELTKLDAMLPVCRSNGVMVVVDLHSLAGGVLRSAANQTKFKEVWTVIATRYRNSSFRDVIWGYDLANEPQPFEWREGALLWNDIAAETSLLIRGIDPAMPIIMETHISGPLEFENLRPLPVSNVIYSTHMYIPGEFTHQNVLDGYTNTYSYPGVISSTGWSGITNWNSNSVELALQRAVTFASNYSAHIYIGEFSAVRWAPGASNYLADCIAIFEKNGWDWTYHAFREWSGWDAEYGDNAGDLSHPVSSGRQTVLRRWYGFNELDAYGIPCNWKMEYFGSTNAANAGALDDWDNDGVNNVTEYLAGTDPTNARSRLSLAAPGFYGGGTNVVIQWSSVAGKWYSLRTATNLLTGFDGVALNSIPATPVLNSHTVTVYQAASRYFRVTVDR